MKQLNIKNNLIFIIKMFLAKPSLFLILGLLFMLNIFLFLFKNKILKKITKLIIILTLIVYTSIQIDFWSFILKYIFYPKPYIIFISFLILLILNLIAKFRIQKIFLMITNTLYTFCILIFVIYFWQVKDTIKYNYLFYKNTKLLNLIVFSNLSIIFYMLISLFIIIYYKLVYGKKFIYDESKFIEKL